MKAYLGRRWRFASSHRLHAESLSASENASVYGKCNNPHGHGHNYTVEVLVGGEVDAVTGMVCDLVELDRFAQKHVLEAYDHQNLNTLDVFQNLVPTTENLCREIYRVFHEGFTAAKVERVRVEETSNNSFEYAGE